ncbi:MAG: GFA family protein [Gammaproteobacteria bacterium]|nr:GFA family protein [Gammaproteobacteria bacterium]MDH4255138.1 GFA family protein [Gammaproteobacteria bacterium]MDH5309828.1 GFA family protein [Gammaproteobacteria bacterium]
MRLPLTGNCQCGSVRYEVSKAPIVTVACHCRDCQKLSASAFSITMVIPADAFRLLSGELAAFERPTDSGGTAVCYFCPTCSNRVYHVDPGRPAYFRLKPGGLDDTSQIMPEAHVWTSRAQPWFTFPEGVPTYETQPDLQEFLAERARRSAD